MRWDFVIMLLFATQIINRTLSYQYLTKNVKKHIRTKSISISSSSSSSSSSTTVSSSSSSSSSIALPGHVYYVSTPIGNLQDISKRSIDILRNCNIICAEDTRHTIHLLRALNIPYKKVIAHHQYNTNDIIPKIINLVRNEMNSIAVVSDAGTPGISDPGTELAYALAFEKIPIHPIPGPCAIAAALSISGYKSSPFTFYGFLDVKGKLRKQKLKNISNTLHTSVIYESPHRIINTLSDMITYNMGDRPCLLCREMTKIHEEHIRGSVKHCLQILQNRDWSNKPPFDEDIYQNKNKDENEDEKEIEIHNKNEDINEDEISSSNEIIGKKNKIKKKPKLKGDDKKCITVKGEFTVVLGPYEVRSSSTNNNINDDINSNTNSIMDNNTFHSSSKKVKILTMLEYLQNDGMRRSEAVNTVVETLNVSKKHVYKIALIFDDW